MKNMKRLYSIQRNFNETRPGGVQYIVRKRVSIGRVKIGTGYGYTIVSEVSSINLTRGMKSHWYPCDGILYSSDRKRAKRFMYKQMKLLIKQTISDLKK